MTVDIHQPITPAPGGRQFPNIPLPGPDVVWREAFNKKWASLGGAPGKPTGDAEAVTNGHRQGYENGALYCDANLNVTWAYGAIGERYDQMGGPTSWLGFPTSDEQDMSEGGRANTFEHGTIYFWPDTGAIEFAGVIVHYTGLICFGVTDWVAGGFRSHDYPYGVIGAIDPAKQHSAVRTQIYQEVDAGNRRPDLVEVYRGQPTGLVIPVQLINHGIAGDNADSIKGDMENALTEGAKWIEKEVNSVALVGPPLAALFGPSLEKLAPKIADFLAEAINIGEVSLGDDRITLTAKQLVVLAARVNNSTDEGIGYKVQTQLLSRKGASYKLCFGMIGMAPV